MYTFHAKFIPVCELLDTGKQTKCLLVNQHNIHDLSRSVLIHLHSFARKVVSSGQTRYQVGCLLLTRNSISTHASLPCY